MPRVPVVERFDTEEAFQNLRVDDLKPLARLLDDNVPPRKGELAALLTGVMQDPARLCELYSSMSELDQAAVREAVHHPDGALDAALFSAKYGQAPRLGGRSSGTTLRLFFPYGSSLPRDLQQRLSAFVPAPRAAAITPCTELPEQFERQETLWDMETRKRSVETWFEPVRVRETEREALHDLPAVLRLIDAGKLGVSATTHRPGQAALKAVGTVLQGGDFYTGEEEGIEEEERDDLAIKTFAWPLIVQAAGFASLSGARLQLTAAGRKATL